MMQQKSLNDLYDKIKEQTKHILDKNKLLGQPNKKINENDLGQILIKSCDIVYIDYSVEQDMSNYTYAIYNPKVKAYVKDTNFINDLIQYIIINFPDDIKTTANRALKDVDNYIKHSKSLIRKANLPPKNLVKTQNCIIDLKSKETYQFDDDAVKDYDFIDSIRYSLYEISEVNQDKLNIVKQILNDWSQSDEDVLKIMKQLAFSCIEGDGRGVQIILKSEGGDGKSTFNRILSKLSDPSLTITINLDEYKDDNIMNKIQPSTKFIVGDDLSSNFSMSKKSLARLKTLVDGGSINVNEKFMPNKTVQSNALKIQNTNTDVRFFENNAAIQDRILYIEWPHYNFRQNQSTEFNLDQLTGKKGPADKEFMEAFLSYIVNTTEYFTKFSITDKMKNDLLNTLDANDVVVQHLNELEEMGVLNYNMIVFNVIYAHYKDWLNFSNPGSKPLKQIEYTKRMKKLLRDYGYNEDAKRTIRNINKQDFDLNLFDNIYYDESKKSNVVMKPKVDVENQLDEFHFNLKNKSIEDIKIKYSKRFIKEYINYMFQKEQAELMIIFSDYIVEDVHTLDIDTIIEKLIDYYQE